MSDINPRLEAMRRIGDPEVDALVAEYLSSAGRPAAGALMHALFSGGAMPPDHPLIRRYTAALNARPDPSLAPAVSRGQTLFELYGPEILLTLGSYAVPLAYAAGNGVQVIHRARRLKDDPIRRLCDTAQMVINVMQPGGLARGEIGWRSVRKVRLIHAVIRYFVTNHGPVWNDAWGSPVNQEDQAGTLLTFSVGAIHGLRLMGAEIRKEDADDYMAAWAAVGRLLGLDEGLIPVDEIEGAELAKTIGARQHRPTPEGQELMAHLLEAVDSLFPFKGYAVSLSHFFLDSTVYGENVVQILKLPKPNWTRHLVGARAKQKSVVLRLLGWVPGAKKRRRVVARHLVQAMLIMKRPDSHAPFEVPPGLIARWRLARSERRARQRLMLAAANDRAAPAPPPAPS
jgi:hypothetical protein